MALERNFDVPTQILNYPPDCRSLDWLFNVSPRANLNRIGGVLSGQLVGICVLLYLLD